MPTGIGTALAVVGGGLSVASGAMSMVAAGAGLGMTTSGVSQQVEGAKEADAAQQKIIAEQIKQDQVRRQAMELDAKRKQLENLRQLQRTHSLALAYATNQGAQYGSGLQGGYGQASGQANWNAQGINQNLDLGRQIFDSNSLMNYAKMDLSHAQAKSAEGAGMASMGGALLSSAGTIGNIAKNFGGGLTSLGSVFGGGKSNSITPSYEGGTPGYAG